MSACPFCAIVRGDAPATITHKWDDAIAIVPLNPVTPGHLLVIPLHHVSDAGDLPWLTGAMFAHAAGLIRDKAANLITSAGVAATQTVMHLHVHVVPRRHGDGLALPWTEAGT